MRASHEARSLLIDLASRLKRKAHEGGLANGGLMVDRPWLEKRGWRSISTLQRAFQDLIDCGLVVITRQGGRNRPMLFGVTWLSIEVSDTTHSLDFPAAAWKAHRGAYARPEKGAPEPQKNRTAAASAARRASARKNAILGPSDGPRADTTGPSDGQQAMEARPSDGPVVPSFAADVVRQTVTLKSFAICGDDQGSRQAANYPSVLELARRRPATEHVVAEGSS
jgi:hypothetical protein